MMDRRCLICDVELKVHEPAFVVEGNEMRLAHLHCLKEDKLTQRIQFMLSESDYSRLLSAASSEGISKWCREVICRALNDK